MDPATLPPGQRARADFPRFGTHFHRASPPVPDDPVLQIIGAVDRPVRIRVAELRSLPRVERVADFHCVAGWSATGLRWEGVEFATFYERVVAPALVPGTTVTHLVFGGLDGFESAVVLEDALADDVLLADGLDGAPLDGDHGAPLRFVSPSQYGYMSTKHLCRVEVRTEPPRLDRLGAATTVARWGLRSLVFGRHPRARVWEEERLPVIPPQVLRPLYRLVTPGIALLSKRGSR
jgi:DMSO/TMAO reductase YedYZ molybdopterin-dependent catalytic subunit